MKRLSIATAVFLAFAVAPAAQAEKLKVRLVGFQEVPSVSTGASAEFEAVINRAETAIDWQLTYEGLESNATQAHIHFGQRSVNGGISIWLCSNLASPPTPAGFNRACPLRAGSIAGTSMASDVVGPAVQLINPGELAEIIAAIRAGVAYVNIHTVEVPGGEIRGQFRRGHGPHGDHK